MITTEKTCPVKQPEIRPDMIAKAPTETFSLPVLSSKIPKIIHQSWKNDVLPKKFQNWAMTWKTLNPEYSHQLWTDNSNRALVANYYPWYLSTYDSLPKNINRADAVRYMYMHQFGGVYADLDVEAIKPFDDLLDAVHAALNSEDVVVDVKSSSDPPLGMITLENVLLKGGVKKGVSGGPGLLLPLMGTKYNFKHNIPNAWMASRPGHPFWMVCLVVIGDRLKEWEEIGRVNRENGVCEDVKVGVEEMTGPAMLFEAVSRYNLLPVSKVEKVYFLEPGVVFPFNWDGASQEIFNICSAAFGSFNEDKCKEMYNATGKPEQKAWSITYWSHSWEGNKNMVIEVEKGKPVR
ncbi:hypothetical protein HK096_005178, partial [Nowakowskiella sp. JEL0078]